MPDYTLPQPIFSGFNGNHCNSHDDLAYKGIYGSPCLAGELISLNDDGSFSGLAVPAGALKALIIIEPEPTANRSLVLARFKSCGDNPTPTDGIPLFAFACFEISNPQTLANFKICAADALSHSVRVLYSNNSVDIKSIGSFPSVGGGGGGGLTDAQLRASAVQFVALRNSNNATLNTLNLNLAGVGTPNSFINIVSSGTNSAAIQVTGSFVGTLSLQYSLNNTVFVTAVGNVFYNVGTGAYSASITAPGIYQIDTTGISFPRVTFSAYTSGSALVLFSTSENQRSETNWPALSTGSNVIGRVDINSNQSIALIPPSAAAAISQSYHKRIATGDTNLTSVKASVGNVFSIEIANFSAAVIYVKLYNKATAPVIASDAALILKTIGVPAGQTLCVPLSSTGLRFTTGIAYAITGGIADTDATVVATGIAVNITFN